MSAPLIDLIVARSKSTLRKAWPQQQQIKLEVRNVEHAVSCPCGTFSSIQHNKIRDIFSQLLSEIYPCVGTVLTLQPEAFGTVSKRKHFMILGFLIPTILQIANSHSILLQETQVEERKRRE